MKLSRRSASWHATQIERSPQHGFAYVAKREAQLAWLDAATPAERALVTEYGFDRAMLALQRFGVRDAAEYLRAERKALQVQRWESIKPN